jgi:hypothetical protein
MSLIVLYYIGLIFAATFLLVALPVLLLPIKGLRNLWHKYLWSTEGEE